MNKKKGFTLIELLAVIMILTIIALIAIPTIINIITKARRSAFKDSVYGIIKAGELYYSGKVLNQESIESDYEFIFPNDIKDLKIKGNKPSKGNMIVSKNGDIAVALSDGKYCVRKGYLDNDVTIDEDVDNCRTKEQANFILISDIKIEETEVIISPLETKKLSITITPSNATYKELEYISSDNSIATVNNGIITGISNGNATIEVKSTDGSNISKIINVTVKNSNLNINSDDKCIKYINNTCSNGTLVNVQVNDLENYNFYVIKDTGEELTLIMDRNLGDKVAWYTFADNTKGPLTALEALESRTSGWSNIPSFTYTLIDEGKSYSPITRYNVKARMLNYTEATGLGCQSHSESCPSYLYSNLSNLNTTEQPYGYLTSTGNSGDHNCIWDILYDGGFYGSGFVANTTYYGVRPVIIISKTL